VYGIHDGIHDGFLGYGEMWLSNAAHGLPEASDTTYRPLPLGSEYDIVKKYRGAGQLRVKETCGGGREPAREVERGGASLAADSQS
jgi:hypothetical protein